MPFCQWTDGMSVGYPLIDRDHQKLVDHVNTMYDAVMMGRGKEILGLLLNNLVAHTREHFFREELVWKAGNYIDFARHKKEHEDLLKTVSDFQAKFTAGSATLSVEVMNGLRDWLRNHILLSDKEAADAIAAGRAVSLSSGLEPENAAPPALK